VIQVVEHLQLLELVDLVEDEHGRRREFGGESIQYCRRGRGRRVETTGTAQFRQQRVEYTVAGAVGPATDLGCGEGSFSFEVLEQGRDTGRLAGATGPPAEQACRHSPVKNRAERGAHRLEFAGAVVKVAREPRLREDALPRDEWLTTGFEHVVPSTGVVHESLRRRSDFPLVPDFQGGNI